MATALALSDPFSSAAVSWAHHGGKAVEKNTPSTDREFRERFVAAMRRRVGPGTALTYKHVANVVNKHPKTVQAWCEGLQGIGADDLEKLRGFFDMAFACEVHNAYIIPLSQLRNNRELADALAVLARATA